jgi:hypothetical protein
MRDLAVLIPTRGRPDNVRKVVAAWDFTNAWDDADMVLVIDQDDPEVSGYRALESDLRHPDTDEPLIKLYEVPSHVPMVYKLDEAAVAMAPGWFALGFAGDDHLPRTINWAKVYLEQLHELGSGMVYSDDGYQGVKLSTEWAVTSDAVRALGRMVPAPVEHMYCDNAMMDLYGDAGALRHLPWVRIEHMHPIVGKAPSDAQYQRVNHRDQFRKDRMAYESWRRSGLAADVATVRALRPGVAEERPIRPVAARPPARRRYDGPMRSGPTRRRMAEMKRNTFAFSHEFRHVRGATPDEIGMALADFASRVPADQEIVELGVFQGRTALIMAWGAAQGHGAHVTAIDPWDTEGNVYDPPFTDPESRIWAEYRVRELGYSDRIALVQAFSQDAAERWGAGDDAAHGGEDPGVFSGAIAWAKPVGLLFVDGDHTYEGARRDIEAWAPHLAPGATIAVDDYHHPDWPGVAEAVDALVAEGVLAPVEVFHDRLAVTRLAVTRLASDPAPTTAITSEGVSPSPVFEEAEEPVTHALVNAELERVGLDERSLNDEWRRVDPEGVAALEESAAALTRNGQVHEGELAGVADGTPIESLTIPQMKTLARRRNIVLGIRKDKRAEIIQALRDGR